MIKYLKFDPEGITKIGCMCCGKTIARRLNRDGQERIVHGTSSTTKQIQYKDGSWGNVLVCKKCVNNTLDLKDIQKTLRWGWEAELDWKLNSYVGGTKQKVKELWENKFGKCVETENKFMIPKDVMEKIYKDKVVTGELKNVISSKQI